MNLFNKSKQESSEEKSKWVRVAGYKGMTKNMKAYDNFQYELGKTYKTSHTEKCKKGFHLCLKLEDTFNYYDLGKEGNRFFKVSALVKQEDLDKYGKSTWSIFQSANLKEDKLVAKEITIVEEVTKEELYKTILESYNVSNEPVLLEEKDCEKVLEEGVHLVKFRKYIKKVMDLGYSKETLFVLTEGMTYTTGVRLCRFIICMNKEFNDKDALMTAILNERARLFIR